MWLILLDPYLASIIFPCTSPPFCLSPLVFSLSSPMLRFTKLKMSGYSYDPESFEAVAFARLFSFGTLFYRVDHNSINLLTFIQALLSALEPHATLSATTSS